ncbi:hypothetical protein ABMA28_010970 [Loxostege sticticalis]|uniref:Uncharacterized protein n=1 Tax=Loxostege sticticalis TaxID=481309 RepID=A0ABD0S8I9_LOXSC
MNQKKCHVEPNPPIPPPDPCILQKIKQKEAAGITICPKEPVPEPEPAPVCSAVCIERLKNPPIPPSPPFPIVCPVEREPTGTARCDAIYDADAEHPDLAWPGCPPQPPLPPPPEIDPCELQRRKEKKAECKERMKRYLE